MINRLRLAYLRRKARHHRDIMRHIRARLGRRNAPCDVDRARLVSPYYERLHDQLGAIVDELAWRTEALNDLRRLKDAQKQGQERNPTD